MNKIYLKPIAPDNTPELNVIRSVYESSFPADERREFSVMMELLRNTPAFRLFAVEQDGAVVGLLSDWTLDNFRYIEHLAISSTHRGGGIGYKIVQSWLQENRELPVVIEVERPDDETSIKRIRFYERLGFTLHQADFIQPAYDADKNPVPMYLMTYGPVDMDSSYQDIRNQLYRIVYRVTTE